MIKLQTGQVLFGVASVANKVTVTLSGEDHPLWSSVVWPVQAQLGTGATPIVTGQVVITDIQVANTDSAPRTIQLFVGGTAMANLILPSISLDAGGMAAYGQNGWQFLDANGAVKQASSGGGGGAPSGAAGGELAGTYPNPTVAATHAGGTHHAAFVQADHDLLPNPHHAAFTTADHAGLPNPHHASYVAADHTAVGSASPHLALASAAPPKVAAGALGVVGNGTAAARDNHTHQESGGVAARTAPTSAFNTTETQLVGFTIPANLLTVGSTFRLTANGICTSTVANAATFRCRIGSTTLTGNIACAVAPVGTTTAASAPFMVDMIVTIRSIGAGGSVIGNGAVTANSAVGALQAFTGFQTLSATVATVAVDTTASKVIELTAVTAAATTTLTVHNALLDWTLM